MFHHESEVIAWINGQLRFGIRPGLERMEKALTCLNNPHLTVPTIHIAGTNGKGSTVTYLRCVLEEAGYQVGTFTSPYIETFNERISLNGHPISGEDLVQCANRVYPIIETINQSDLGPFTEFEIITLLSFVYFSEIEVDVLIYEVGLGGRLDATNVISPMVCGITNIGHDHEKILGPTKIQIAHEKLGIVKQGVTLITTEEDPDVLAEFETITHKRQCSLIKALEIYRPTQVSLSEDGVTFNWPSLEGIQLSMKGEHQVKNATLAYGILKYLKEKRKFTISSVHIYRGMKLAFWAGRFEVIHKQPLIVLDGAHNVEGMKNLCQTVKKLYPNKKKVFMVSILKDKDATEMFKYLEKVADEVYFTTFNHPRAQSAKEQYELYHRKNAGYHEEFHSLFQSVTQTLCEGDCLVITGSLYFISEVRKSILLGDLDNFFEPHLV